MGHAIYAAPTSEPITLNDVKAQSRITSLDEDEYLVALIAAARDKIENYLSMQFCTATWNLTLDAFANPIELPRWPLKTIDSIKYLDANGVEQTLAATTYEAVTNVTPGLVRLAYLKTWPSIRSYPDAVRIRYTAGYGATSSTIPARAKQALRLLVAHWYESREPVVTGTIIADVPESYKSLLWSLKIR